MTLKLPSRAISIQQPWAWLIVNGHKDIENRTWKHSFRGEVLIHAGQKIDMDANSLLSRGLHPADHLQTLAAGISNRWQTAKRAQITGGYVGIAEVVDCVSASTSPWFVGDYGFVLRNARPIEFISAPGRLGFFQTGF